MLFEAGETAQPSKIEPALGSAALCEAMLIYSSAGYFVSHTLVRASVCGWSLESGNVPCDNFETFTWQPEACYLN